MVHAIALLIVFFAGATWARAEEALSLSGSLHLTTEQLMPFFDALPSPARQAADPVPAGFREYLKRRSELDLQPFFLVLPPAVGENEDVGPPLFAFVARAQGRTVISVTRPGAKVDPDDQVLFQRTLVSDLFEGRSFSLTVFEDHALSGSAAELLGVGARLMFRPTFEVLGWRARVEMFVSYDPDDGPTGYVGIAGRGPRPPNRLLPFADPAQTVRPYDASTSPAD